MAVGWESFVHIRENSSGFGTLTASGGYSIDADSISPKQGEEVRLYNDRMVHERFPTETSFQQGMAKPGGDMVFNPTIGELPPILMSVFQAVGVATISKGTVTGGTFYGTLVYSQIRSQPDFTGSTWGTIKSSGVSALTLGTGTITQGDVYPLDILAFYGDSIGTSHRQSNVIGDSLVFDSQIGQNLKLTYNFKSATYDGTYTAVVPVATFVLNELEYPDWRATVSIGAVAYDIEGLQFTVTNALQEVDSLGKRMTSKMKLGNDLPTGNFSYELVDNGLFNTYSSAIIDINWFLETNTWMRAYMPNCKFGDYNKDIKGGNARQVNSVPFTAYPSGAGAGTPAITLILHGTFATRGFTCFGQ